jgi:hypothetical protein
MTSLDVQKKIIVGRLLKYQMDTNIANFETTILVNKMQFMRYVSPIQLWKLMKTPS